MECAQITAALIGSIILLLPNVALLVYADGSQPRNCTASDLNCINGNKIDLGKDIRTPADKNRNKKSEASDKYGLVPPFLGAASAVIIIYIVIHCLYLHCYAKKKMKRMAQHNALHSQTRATIVMTDHPSSASMQPMTPIVKYEGAYGKTEVLQPQPYFMRSISTQSQGQGQKDLSPGGATTSTGSSDTRQLFQSPPSPKPVEIIKSGAKRTSSLLSSMKSRSSKKSSSRMSTSSIGTDVSISLNEQEVLLRAQRSSLDQGMGPAIKTNVCFVPLGKTVSEIQANDSSEWIPVQGYIYNPKGQENGNLNSSLNSLQNYASQIVFIPMTSTSKTSTVDNNSEQDNPVAMDTVVSSGNNGNVEMEVFPEESESKEESNENESLIKVDKAECDVEVESPSDTEAQPETENVTVEVHNNPAVTAT